MKTLLFTSLMLLSQFSFAAQTTNGLCEDQAVLEALSTSPGIDEFSTATLVEVKLVKQSQEWEKYLITTEDQGGEATSLITVEVNGGDCKLYTTEWIE